MKKTVTFQVEIPRDFEVSTTEVITLDRFGTKYKTNLVPVDSAVQGESGGAVAPQMAPKHKFFGAGETDCPREIKAGNGELHTLRCRICGKDNPLGDACFAAGATPSPQSEQAGVVDKSAAQVKRFAPASWKTEEAATCFAKCGQSGEGSQYCPECGENTGSTYLDAPRPMKSDAICWKCSDKVFHTIDEYGGSVLFEEDLLAATSPAQAEE